MKKYWQNDKGYSLLLAIFAILIFSVLGLSLIILTSNGTAKNTNREEIIQAQDLSDKGIEYVVGDIQKTLENQIVATPMGKTDFGIFLNNTLNKANLKCPTTGQSIPNNIGYQIPAENNNSTKVCIEAVKLIEDTLGNTEEKDMYKRIVTFKSIGIVNGKEHISRSDVIIGTDAIPDQLRYAVSSNDEGNIFLHGGVEIQGDIKTDGNLIVSNKASIGDTGNFSWATPTSVHARLIKNVDSVTPKIILRENSQTVNKDIYFLKSNSRSYNNHINVSDSTLRTNSDYAKYIPDSPEAKNSSSYNNSHTKFFYSENVSIHRRNLPQDSLDVPKLISESINLTGISKQGAININSVTNFNSSVLKKATKDSKFLYQEEYEECVQYSGSGWNRYCSRYETRTKNANVTIAPQNKSSNNAVELKGTHYITGNLTIEEAKIASDAILYVNGNVKITDSVLNSLNEGGTLIIFANGTISLSNISRYISTASKINAFLYSSQELRIYGSGSNIEITGGVSGKKVILSGIRGESSSSRYESTNNQLKTTQSNGKTIPATRSRLKIIYDQDLIKAYTSFKRDEEEEYITQINPPEVIKRY